MPVFIVAAKVLIDFGYYLLIKAQDYSLVKFNLKSSVYLITHMSQPSLAAYKASVASEPPLSENVGAWHRGHSAG